MAVPKMNNGHDTVQAYFWDGLRDDPYEGIERLHKVADALRAEESEDFEDEADDLDDAATELEQLLDRIVSTFEDEVGYGIKGGSEYFLKRGDYDEQIKADRGQA